MKLPSSELTLAEQLREFDIWITPSLGEIQDTNRFKDELESVVRVFEALSLATNNFDNLDVLDTSTVASEFIRAIREVNTEEAESLLLDLASTLFLVTGKSDNNSKCQFPLYLRDQTKWNSLPTVRGRKNPKVIQDSIPRVLKAESYMKRIAKLSMRPDLQVMLLDQFIHFILSSDLHVSQLMSIGHSYCSLRTLGRERDLLTPLVVFQVRGSVSASGGHEPEEILRSQLKDWGLERGIDFNLNDVVVEQKTESSSRKTRAYDFVLPFKTNSWRKWPEMRIFVQCQFYAGDSGSVSHKNVDQARTSRLRVSGQVTNPFFIEFVDGAGYYSSLNGYLKKLLDMPDTYSFFQLRSASIRLRRNLQTIGFLTPLEVEHAIVTSDATEQSVITKLVNDGYNENHAIQQLERAISRGLIVKSGAGLELNQSRKDIVRRYLLLDVAAILGEPMELNSKTSNGIFLVPGYGPFYGLKLQELAKACQEVTPMFRMQFADTETFIGDIS